MPGGDRRGPMGQGPMTGQAMGHCGRRVEVNMNMGPKRFGGMGQNSQNIGFGGGRRMGNFQYGKGGGFWRRRKCLSGFGPLPPENETGEKS